MLVNLEILSAKQFVGGGPASADVELVNSVGSTHFDAGTVLPDGTIVYNYTNLWMRYEVKIPRRLRHFQFEAAYQQALNEPAYVRGQRFGWSLGTEDRPGEERVFYWDIEAKSSGLLQEDIKILPGRIWLWLTYDYTGQNNCFVTGVRFPLLQGEAVGPGRIAVNGSMKTGAPHIVIDGAFKEVSAYVCKDGVWRPTS